MWPATAFAGVVLWRPAALSERGGIAGVVLPGLLADLVMGGLDISASSAVIEGLEVAAVLVP